MDCCEVLIPKANRSSLDIVHNSTKRPRTLCPAVVINVPDGSGRMVLSIGGHSAEGRMRSVVPAGTRNTFRAGSGRAGSPSVRARPAPRSTLSNGSNLAPIRGEFIDAPLRGHGDDVARGS